MTNLELTEAWATIDEQKKRIAELTSELDAAVRRFEQFKGAAHGALPPGNLSH